MKVTLIFIAGAIRLFSLINSNFAIMIGLNDIFKDGYDPELKKEVAKCKDTCKEGSTRKPEHHVICDENNLEKLNKLIYPVERGGEDQDIK